MILAGGYGTRISEESAVRPKPMVEIGDMPILWHIMKIYSQYGVRDFVICCGYKGHLIKEWFASYMMRSADVTFDFSNDTTTIHKNSIDPWRVTLVNTGSKTMTGGRIKRALSYMGDEPFCMTYGDGVANVDVHELTEFHRNHGKMVTMTAVQPESQFGLFTLKAQQTTIEQFQEKPPLEGAWINGGFFVLDPTIGDYIKDDDSVWELAPLQTLAAKGEVSAYRHEGFWMAMDTLRDKHELERMWQCKQAPWKVWE